MTKSTLNEYILLDRSGSMSNRWGEALSSINAYVEDAKGKVKTKVTVATFDSQVDMIFDIIRDKQSAKKWEPLTDKDATPRGMTPLFDAIGKVVTLAEGQDHKQTVIVVMTDGAENSSREVSQEAAKAALDRCRAKGWQVVFLGADFDAVRQGATVGVTMDSAINMTAGNYGATMRGVRHKTMAYASGAGDVSFSDEDRKDATK